MSKPKHPPPLSEAQLEIMNVIWDRGEVTVGEVWKALCRRRNVARNTILTMVTRLEEKGWLRHRAQGNTFWYRAVVPRKATLTRMVHQLVSTAFRGSAMGLVMTLVESGSLSEEEAKGIREMLEKAEQDERSPQH